jgi:GMP synthase (glutamine-hydrolysing)
MAVRRVAPVPLVSERGAAVRLLVADGDAAEGRRRVAQTAGATFAETYAGVLRTIVPSAQIDIATPADGGTSPPADLGSYDGVVITGSSLNVYKRESPSLRQIDFVREVFDRGVPMFGSCWGLQLAAVAAGGEVAPNRNGREVAFARHITLTDAGRRHAMHEGRPSSFDAPAIHGDEVVRLPGDAIVTAENSVSRVQAAEIRFNNGVFWGVQYHPELSLHDIAATVRRNQNALLAEGFFFSADDLERYAADLDLLQRDRKRRDIAWRIGLGVEITDDRKRICEISNWIARWVVPKMHDRH